MLGQGVQNYMFTRKNKTSLLLRSNYIWAINLILFAGVVFLGIEQAGRGADISLLEDNLENVSIQKRELAEKIFITGSEVSLANNASDSGFIKPSNVYYFNSIDTVASRR